MGSLPTNGRLSKLKGRSALRKPLWRRLSTLGLMVYTFPSVHLRIVDYAVDTTSTGDPERSVDDAST
jgi:hypothetical protein